MTPLSRNARYAGGGWSLGVAHTLEKGARYCAMLDPWVFECCDQRIASPWLCPTSSARVSNCEFGQNDRIEGGNRRRRASSIASKKHAVDHSTNNRVRPGVQNYRKTRSNDRFTL